MTTFTKTAPAIIRGIVIGINTAYRSVVADISNHNQMDTAFNSALNQKTFTKHAHSFTISPMEARMSQLQNQSQLTDKQLLQSYVKKMKARGWQVESASVSMGVSMKKPKRWNRLLIILGLVGLLFGGLGIIVLILALIDYLIKKERSVFVTADDLRSGNEPVIASDWSTPMILAGLLIAGFMAMIMFYFIIGLLLG